MIRHAKPPATTSAVTVVLGGLSSLLQRARLREKAKGAPDWPAIDYELDFLEGLTLSREIDFVWHIRDSRDDASLGGVPRAQETRTLR